jgi:GH15 family glucan-1,4-alpha-glucosidase
LSEARGKAPRRIENYALIGDCETAALVGRDASIDWLCWPRFDSAACFAALLGGPEHGRWLIAPKDPDARVGRRYLDGSLILVTTFETAQGTVELIDFMPPRDGISDLVRLVRGVRGRIELRTEFVLRFDYGSVVPWTGWCFARRRGSTAMISRPSASSLSAAATSCHSS